MHFLITAGPTREYFDSVRFISNASSGRMGYALADVARQRGHQVTLISGPVGLEPPPVEVVQVTTAEEMFAAALTAFDGCDVAIMTAAVTDWRPKNPADRKQPKPSGPVTVELEPTPDICATLGARKGGRMVVGFAVQDESPHARAAEKMARKNCDMMILNGPVTLGSDTIRYQVKIGAAPWTEEQCLSKTVAAARLIQLIERQVDQRAD